MAFTRTQMVAAVAGTLSLAVLTGCPASTPGAVNPSTMPSGSAAPSAMPSGTTPSAMPSGTTPSAMPSGTTPSAMPSGNGSTAPSTAPSASAPAPSGEKVILSGNVYDEDGATVDGALVTVKSLDASVPYTATATTSQGSYVVNNVPEGANVEVIATKDGWTSRRRVGSFQKQATGTRNTINFGAAGGNANTNDTNSDATGESYFISDYPEISSTEPKTDATGVDNSKLTFKLRLSETLDEDSRDSLVQALTILPANLEAAGNINSGSTATPQAAIDSTGPLDFETREDDDAADGTHDTFDGRTFDLTDATTREITLANYGYAIEEGSTFLGNSDRDVTATWNAEGTELTFSFDATLLAADNDEAKYQAVLVSQGTNTDEKIEDADGNQLGTDEDGDLGSYPTKGTIIANGFKEVDLSAADETTGYANRGESNWGSTHDSYVNWEIKRDEVDPKLTAVDVSKNVDGDFRIELTFSEGMAAYNGTSSGASDSTELADLENNYRFALGDKVGDTDDINLSDKPTLTDNRVIDPRTTGDGGDGNFDTETFGEDADNELEEDFTFENDARDLTSTNIDAVTAGRIFVEVDDSNPNTVFIWIKDRANFFASQASEIKAYVEGVADPAGNKISDNDAEKNQVRGTI